MAALTGAGGLPVRSGYLSADPGVGALTGAVRALAGLLQPSLIAVDLADLRAVLEGGGRAAYGEGEAAGPDRARRAAEAALADLRGRA